MATTWVGLEGGWRCGVKGVQTPLHFTDVVIQTKKAVERRRNYGASDPS
jgi:hypothetical protein